MVRYSAAMRSFNTTGPVRPEEHYCISPLERLDLDGVLGLIRGEKYFILHAPRQTGKTSTLLALRDLLNSGSVGGFRCVYANEVGQSTRDDPCGRCAQSSPNWRWRRRKRLKKTWFSGCGRECWPSECPPEFGSDLEEEAWGMRVVLLDTFLYKPRRKAR